MDYYTFKWLIPIKSTPWFRLSWEKLALQEHKFLRSWLEAYGD